MTTPEHTPKPRRTQPTLVRFMRHVAIDATSGCWQWQGTINHKGYGRFVLDGRTPGAHRVAYALLVGPIPEGMELDHLCRNRACVNPEHLEPVTRHEHWSRGSSVSVLNAAKKTCVKGHPFTEENTYVWEHEGKQYRHCRTCNREGSQKYAAARRSPVDGRRRLTEEQIATAVVAYQSGASLSAVAGKMGVAYSTIRAHLQRLGIPRRPPVRITRSEAR